MEQGEINTGGSGKRLLGVCERTYRRYLVRYEEQGMEGLVDRRLGQISHRSAPVDKKLLIPETKVRAFKKYFYLGTYSSYRIADLFPVFLRYNYWLMACSTNKLI